ncbi:MAG: hypothetical protein LBO20_04825, partial [Bifidobacteriaceae bacterium]|nr:hypothetical protein [Bifidobacteriaceae bacterium]
WLCVTVPGEVIASLELRDYRAAYRVGAAGFGAGSVRLTGEVVNTGSIRLGAGAKVRLSGPFGLWRRSGIEIQVPELLPGQSIRFDKTVTGVGPWFRLSAAFDLVSHPREGLPQAPSVFQSRSFWAAPWIAVLAALAAGGSVWWLATVRRRRRRRIDRAVAEALAAVRAPSAEDAAGDPPGDSVEDRPQDNRDSTEDGPQDKE